MIKSIKYTNQVGKGKWRAVYQLGNRVVHFHGYADSESEANQWLIDNEWRAAKSLRKEDVSEAIELEILAIYKTATKDQVRWGYLQLGMAQRKGHEFRAHSYLKKAGMPINQSNAMIAARFSEPNEKPVRPKDIQKIKDRWAKLKTMNDDDSLLEKYDTKVNQ